MKNLLCSSIRAVIFLSICISCGKSGDTKISVKDSDDSYEFYAKYDKKKTREVQEFINRNIAPSKFITGEDLDITATLDDHTQFELEESPGKIHIKLDKEDNSTSSYLRIKKLCEGIKGVIGEKKT